jgi:hypothetical protein
VAAALAQGVELRVDLGQLGVELAARCCLGLGLLLQAQHSTCSWCARVCASAASRRALARRSEASV